MMRKSKQLGSAGVANASTEPCTSSPDVDQYLLALRGNGAELKRLFLNQALEVQLLLGRHSHQLAQLVLAGNDDEADELLRQVCQPIIDGAMHAAERCATWDAQFATLRRKFPSDNRLKVKPLGSNSVERVTSLLSASLEAVEQQIVTDLPEFPARWASAHVDSVRQRYASLVADEFTQRRRANLVAQASDLPPGGNEDQVLGLREQLALQSLLQLDAIDSDRLVSTKDVATKAEGDEADENQYKKPIATLKKLGLVATQEGRGGGCWLTPDGRLRAQKLCC